MSARYKRRIMLFWKASSRRASTSTSAACSWALSLSTPTGLFICLPRHFASSRLYQRLCHSLNYNFIVSHTQRSFSGSLKWFHISMTTWEIVCFWGRTYEELWLSRDSSVASLSRIIESPSETVHHKSSSCLCSSFELNLSVLQSGFTLYRKYKPSSDDSLKVKVLIIHASLWAFTRTLLRYIGYTSWHYI